MKPLFCAPAFADGVVFVFKGAEIVALFPEIDEGGIHSGAGVLIDTGTAGGVVAANVFGGDEGTETGAVGDVAAIRGTIRAGGAVETAAGAHMAVPENADGVKRGVAAVALTFPDNGTAGIAAVGGRERDQGTETLAGDVFGAHGDHVLRQKTAAGARVAPFDICRGNDDLFAAGARKRPAVLLFFIIILKGTGGQAAENLTGNVPGRTARAAHTATALRVPIAQIHRGHFFFPSAVADTAPDDPTPFLRAQRFHRREKTEFLSCQIVFHVTVSRHFYNFDGWVS